MDKVTQREKFDTALKKLEKALKQPESSELSIDGTIQRFEFSFELGWKALKETLSLSKGIDPKFPKPIFQEAFRAGWIHDEQLWLDMLNDRNNTSHTYDEKLALAIYRRIRDRYFPELQRILQVLKTA
jgi:nucleotidyltransferase substrate binding protein (TIGR01987 family)